LQENGRGLIKILPQHLPEGTEKIHGKPVRIAGVSARLERSACKIPLCLSARSQLRVNTRLQLEIKISIYDYTSVVLAEVHIAIKTFSLLIDSVPV
jgi:hypothetical protein